MRSSWGRLRVVFLAALGMGCSDMTTLGSQDVRLTTDRLQYSVGSSGVLTLRNLGPHPISPGNEGGTLLCQAQVEKAVNGEWSSSGTLPGACLLIGLPPLEVGGAAYRSFDVTSDLWGSEGTYRFRATLMDASTNEAIVVLSDSI